MKIQLLLWTRVMKLIPDWINPLARDRKAIPGGDPEQKSNRYIRRIAMQSDQHGEILRHLQGGLNNVTSMIDTLCSDISARKQGVSVAEEHLVEALDRLTVLRRQLGAKTGQGQLVEEVQNSLELAAGWRPIAEVKAPYSPLDCRVSVSIAADEPEGTILEVMQQGYHRADGSRYRRATVAVSKGPATAQELSPARNISESPQTGWNDPLNY